MWYVLHVKPRMEKKVYAELRLLNVFCYLPLYRMVTKVQRRKVVRELPLFPGYVFTRLSPDARREILKTQRIVRTIEVAEPRKMIHELRQIRHAGRLPVDLKAISTFEVGERVRMSSGPFCGLEGYVQRKGSATSLVLTLEILGRAVEVSVSPVDLERAT